MCRKGKFCLIPPWTLAYIGASHSLLYQIYIQDHSPLQLKRGKCTLKEWMAQKDSLPQKWSPFYSNTSQTHSQLWGQYTAAFP